MRKPINLYLEFFIIILVTTVLNCQQKNERLIGFVSEQANGDLLTFIFEDGSESGYTPMNLANCNLVSNSLRSGKKSYVAFLCRKETDWLHGASTHTSLQCISLIDQSTIVVTDWNKWETINYSWNLEGDKLFYASMEKGAEGIYRLEISLLRKERIIAEGENNSFGYVRISFSGEKIAFVDKVEVYVAELKDNSIYKLPLASSFLDYLEWFPGDSVLLISTESGFIKYNLINNQKTKLFIDGFDIDVAPAGSMIVFVIAESDSITNIYTMDADGKGLKKLTHLGANGTPVWSKDSEKITFTSNRDGNWEIYIMDKDGRNQRRLTQNEVTDHSPLWLTGK